LPSSRSLLLRQTGKPLWAMALAFWLAVGPAQAEDLSWAEEKMKDVVDAYR
jgi:hypothetical protein